MVLIYSATLHLNSFAVCSYNSTDSSVNIMVSAPDAPVDANSSVRLVCTASGDPAPDISWTLEDTTFSNCTSERV